MGNRFLGSRRGQIFGRVVVWKDGNFGRKSYSYGWVLWRCRWYVSSHLETTWSAEDPLATAAPLIHFFWEMRLSLGLGPHFARVSSCSCRPFRRGCVRSFPSRKGAPQRERCTRRVWAEIGRIVRRRREIGVLPWSPSTAFACCWAGAESGKGATIATSTSACLQLTNPKRGYSSIRHSIYTSLSQCGLCTTNLHTWSLTVTLPWPSSRSKTASRMYSFWISGRYHFSSPILTLSSGGSRRMLPRVSTVSISGVHTQTGSRLGAKMRGKFD